MSQVHKVSRREFLSISGLAVAGLTLASCQPIVIQQAAPTPEPAVTNADEALQRLKEGNQRFVTNKTVDPN